MTNNIPKFYACSVGEPGKEYDEENLQRILEQNAFILHQDTLQKGAYENISEGDILILKYKTKFIGYGEALQIKTTDAKEWNLLAPVKKWYFKNIDNKEDGIETYGIGFNTEAGGQYGTVKELNEKFGFEKLKQIDQASDLFIKINNNFSKAIIKKNMNDIINLLEYKKQIILQGPPGTGKTKLAKEIAKAMTESKILGSPREKVEEFFAANKVASIEVQLKRAQMQGYLLEFLKKFPKDNLQKLKLEDYAFGDGDNDSFCWWIEYGLWDLGGYSGPAGKFKIYWKKRIQSYLKSGFIKNIDDDTEAMRMVAEQLYNTANELQLSEALNKLSSGLVLKILHTYHPDKYFPVNNDKLITNILKLLGINTEGDIFEKNKKIQAFFIAKKNETGADITNVEFMRFLFANFDIKGEISFQVNELIAKGYYKLIQFHPAYSYEDFVRSIVIETNDKGQPVYLVADKILAEMAQKALDNPSSKFILIIDEINRANLPAVLGELIYALEYRWDENNSADTIVESVYAKKDNDEETGDRRLRLPDNLLIIGTMNTADRSVGHIDYAIRRRFAFVDIPPKDLSAELGNDFMTDYYNKVYNLFYKKENGCLSSEFEPGQVCLGHSYFIQQYKKDTAGNNTTEKIDFGLRLKYEIVPILEEYIRDGVLRGNETVRKTIDELKGAAGA